MPGGGKQPGAGRPKGSRDKFNVKLHERLAGTDDDPAKVLQGLMKDKNKSIRLRAAIALMQHVYPKLSAAQVEVENKQPVNIEIV